MKNKKSHAISTFSILYILMILIALISLVFSGSPISPELISVPGNPSSVVAASLSDFLMATYNGFTSSSDITTFILILGSFLAVTTKTGSLKIGMHYISEKLKGKELILIPLLILFFSLSGTTYGMAEEIIPFYTLLTGVLVTAGFDTLVVLGIILLGSQTGVMASMVNPFAIGVAVDALKDIGIDVNLGILIILQFITWLLTVGFIIYYIYSYSKKLKVNINNTLLNKDEKNLMNKYFLEKKAGKCLYSTKHKYVLILFGLAFITMTIGLIPWQQFGITVFNNWSSFLTGNPLGEWYFGDLATWFLLIAILIGIVYRLSEKEIVEAIVKGACDMLPVVLIIVVARGISNLMIKTQLDLFLLDKASIILKTLPPVWFIIGTFVLFLILAFLVPSTSALGYLSMPFMGGLVKLSGVSSEAIICAFTAASGIINIISPTSALVMTSLQITKVEYKTWMKFISIPAIILSVISLIILVIFVGF